MTDRCLVRGLRTPSALKVVDFVTEMNLIFKLNEQYIFNFVFYFNSLMLLLVLHLLDWKWNIKREKKAIIHGMKNTTTSSGIAYLDFGIHPHYSNHTRLSFFEVFISFFFFYIYIYFLEWCAGSSTPITARLTDCPDRQRDHTYTVKADISLWKEN